MNLDSKGAYLFKKDNELVLMIYAELSHDDLQKALPLTDVTNSTHIKAYFVNFTDFIGSLLSSSDADGTAASLWVAMARMGSGREPSAGGSSHTSQA